jgi:hypothetical protein
MRATGALLTAMLLLSTAACTSKDAGNESNGAAAVAYSDDGTAIALPADLAKEPMLEFMNHVMQFSAEQVWKWQGYVTDEKGERSLFPKTDDEWLQAENAALTLADLTNILLLPGRTVDDPRWAKFVADVRVRALEAAQAAEKKDEDALFLAGSDLYEACKACHVQFVPNYQAPPEIVVK